MPPTSVHNILKTHHVAVLILISGLVVAAINPHNIITNTNQHNDDDDDDEDLSNYECVQVQNDGHHFDCRSYCIQAYPESLVDSQTRNRRVGSDSLAARIECCCQASSENERGDKFKRNYMPIAGQQQTHKLEIPLVVLHRQAFNEGPGVNLVALNQRRFEAAHGHEHSSGSLSLADEELRRSELIESKVASIPDRFLNNLPEDVNKQLMDTLATDPSLIVGMPLVNVDDDSQDPDGASIERLTKSCLTVHASSARPEQLNVTFLLFTKNNPLVPFIIRPQISRLELIKSSPFDPSKPIKWITHGFHTNVDKSEWMVETKDKILAFEDANVILTDWRRGASPALAFYPKAAANAHVVAKMIVKILRRLKGDIDFSKIHLIGHSLGAHIMGFVGSAFTEEYLHLQQQRLMLKSQLQLDLQNKQPFWRETVSGAPGNFLIGRITACDPALPCFGPNSSGPNSHGQNSPPPVGSTTIITTQATTTGSYRASQLEPLQTTTATPPAPDWTPVMWTHLRPDSAIVVEVMHSNPGVMGYSEPLGDYDFYPNGFERQPGCGMNQNEAQQHHHQSHEHSPASNNYRHLNKRQMNGFVGSILGSMVPATFRQQQEQAGSGQQSGIQQTIDKFIKPIRDFFHGYTCSHHRSVEYMVESMYYDRIPQDRKLDRDFVCQMVGYRCSDYVSFKRGFCFRCQSDLDCRTFTMSSASVEQNPMQETSRLPVKSSGRSMVRHLDKFKLRELNAGNPSNLSSNENSIINSTYAAKISKIISKRVLPTFNHYNQDYLPQRKAQYYFDTKPYKEFCLHHYHFHIKYRWFRVRDNIDLDGFRLIGTLASITKTSQQQQQQQQQQQLTLNRFTYQSYTMLLTEQIFLGQVESLVIFGDKIKSAYVDFIEITYMSNLDPRIRALGSARLCKLQQPAATGIAAQQQALHQVEELKQLFNNSYSLFVRCSGVLV